MEKQLGARVFVEDDGCDETAAAIFAKIRAGGSEPANIHRTLAAAPTLGGLVIELAWAIRRASVAAEYRELMILRTVQLEGGTYQFAAHVKWGLDNGLTRQQIEGLGADRDGDLFDEKQIAVLDYADALADRGKVPDHVYERLAEHFNPREIAELTIASGAYTMAARVTEGLDVTLDV